MHMQTTNSQCEWVIYHSLFSELYTDLAELISVPPKESQRDLEKIQERFESEGLGFLTKTLPSLGKAFDRALNRIEPLTVPTTFLRKKVDGEVQHFPNLFGWLFQRVIGEDGYPTASVDIDCLRGLRQLMYFVYKLEIPHDQDQERKLLNEFVDVDASLPHVDNLTAYCEEGADNQIILDYAAYITQYIFQDFDYRDIRPRHGPGAVATGERVFEKHQFSRYYEAIHRIYPYDEYYCFSQMAVCDTYHQFENLKSLQAGTAKVVLVPKDSRGPRIISCEPLEYQWIQQGLGRAIVRHLESHWVTRGFVNFTDQTINQQLALNGSADQKWVTLDMKEASDRVSMGLVRRIFWHVQGLLEALSATRTTHTELPDGRIVRLNKFAPMGSCLCFPIEAYVFWVLGVASIIYHGQPSRQFPIPRVRKQTTFTKWLCKHARTVGLYVYGDDIIVKQKFHDVLLHEFPKVDLKFNLEKCCIRGLFRESCGVDAFNGVNVTPLRLKRRWCHRTVDARTLASYVEFSNSAYRKGYKRLAAYAAALVENKIGALPVQSRKGSYLAFIRPTSVIHIPDSVRRRFNSNLQCNEYRVWTIRPQHSVADPDSWCMVLRTQSDKVDLSEDDVITETAQSHTPTGVFALSRRSCLQRVWTRIG